MQRNMFLLITLYHEGNMEEQFLSTDQWDINVNSEKNLFVH